MTEVTSRKMSLTDACLIVEGFEDASKEQYYEAWALIIKSGACNRLQGWYGRNAQTLINRGFISPDGEINWDAIEEND